MKQIRLLLLCAVLLAAVSVSGAGAQTIVMEEGYVAFDYPDSWLVVSPQLCRVYAPLLSDMGRDPGILEEELTEEGVLSRAISETDGQTLSVLIREDDLSREIFNMEEASDAQRRQIRSRAENNDLWEKTGMRAQDCEWQIEGGRYWLYIHYAKMHVSEVVGRGLRYLTVANGRFVMLDWQIEGRRFGNRDLAAFRRRLSDVTFLETLEPPRRTTALACTLPTEVNEAAGRLTGTATAGADIALTADDGKGNTVPLDEATADERGRFTLDYMLPREGEWTLILTAEADGMDTAELTGTLSFSENTLPVSGIAETVTATADKVTISGKTLPGVTMQLVSPYGLTKKRSENDGSFSFELTTKEEGSYDYTLLLDKKGYTQRRLRFTVQREMTDEEQRKAVRDSAVRIAYRQLTQDLPENRGSILNIYGPVQELSEAAGVYYARLMYTRGTSSWSNPVIIVSDKPFGAKEGDMMQCTVEVEGVYEEQDAGGRDVQVPRLRLLFIDKLE